MTTTSDSTVGDLIDFAAYHLDTDDLRTLSSVASIWRGAVLGSDSTAGKDAAVRPFLELTADLPLKIADPEWQRLWVRGWHELVGRGYGQVEIMRWYFEFAAACERALTDGRDSVGRVILALLSTLRRSVIAAVSCAVELGEMASEEAAGLPGELAALRFLRELLSAGRSAGLLSVSLVNRDSFTYLDANDLQRLPATLAARIAARLREEDRVFAGREGEWLAVLPDVQAMSQPVLAGASIERVFGELMA